MKNRYPKLFFLTILSSSPSLSVATTYYVSGAGNDSNNGQTTTTAFRNIQTAADLVQPGDTVLVMNGTYDFVSINVGGTASNWVTFKNYPGHSPKIQFTGWNGIKIGPNVAYLEINGFEIQGNNANVTLAEAQNQPGSCNFPGTPLPAFNGDGIYADGRGAALGTPKPHHIRILNNNVHDCAGAGISLSQSDYVTIKNNKVHNNAWYTVYGTSGIALYQSWNFDNGTGTNGYRNIIEANDVYGNRNLVPTAGYCQFTDGNGIIIDDNKNTQNGSTLGSYNGNTLIQNNKLYQNGGAAVHVYQSQHVTILNNTTYKNIKTPELNYLGEIGPNDSNDIKVINNILYADPNKQYNSNWGLTNIVYSNNLHFNGTAGPISCANCPTANPKFVNEASFDFHLQSTSPAINIGNSGTYAATDFDGQARPIGASPDIGAFEYSTSPAPAQTPIPAPTSVPPSTQAPTSNLLLNPDFEAGTTGWTGLACSIAPSTTSHTGLTSVLTLNRSAAYAGPQQDITSLLNAKGPGNYLAEGWVRAASGSINSQIVIYINANGISSWISTNPASVATTWTKLSKTLNLTWSGTVTAASIYVETLTGTTDFYTDGFILMPQSSVPAPASVPLPAPALSPAPTANLLQNPGFESGITGWSGFGCAIASSTTFHTGTKSVLTSNRAAAWNGPRQDITNLLKTKGPGNYLVEAWVRAVSGSIDSKISIDMTVNGVRTFISTDPATVSTIWAKLSKTLNLTWSGTLNSAYIYVETATGTANFYVDDVTLQ